MKRIYLNGSCEYQLKEAAEIFLSSFDYVLTDERDKADLVVTSVGGNTKKLRVHKDGKECKISYWQKTHFFRGLTLLLQNAEQEKYESTESVNMDSCGVMLDCSRNAVPTVRTVKEYILQLAKFGMNRLYLYMEDTMEIEEYPYWGYFRGRYSRAEMKECDAFAKMFGITLVPCIQTLAHLRSSLKQPAFAEYKDIDDILLLGEKKTKKLLLALLDTVKECFSGGIVHLGMDEAAHLGRGVYLEKNGWKKPSAIMKEHLEWLSDECHRRGLSPMIWSDMYLSLNFNVSNYYGIPETAVPQHADDLSDNVTLCYWDYYNVGKEFYQKYIRIHRKLGNPMIFAGGAWTWNGIAPNYSRAIRTTVDALDACIEEQVKDVFCTAWMDNGSETPVMTMLPILALYGEYCFGERPTLSKVKERYQFCFKKSWEDYCLMEAFDNEDYFRYKLDEEWTSLYHNKWSRNISKTILYQDCLMSFFEKMQDENQMRKQYIYLKEQLEIVLKKQLTDDDRQLFEYYRILAELLSKKAGIGEAIRTIYRESDKKLEEYDKLQKRLQEIAELAEHLRIIREEIWMYEYKPFGYEVIDIRFGGIGTRARSIKKRISDYLTDKCSKIDELEEEILPYQTFNSVQNQQGNYFWEKIISVGNIEGI